LLVAVEVAVILVMDKLVDRVDLVAVAVAQFITAAPIVPVMPHLVEVVDRV
jgi:hypothetical protein